LAKEERGREGSAMSVAYETGRLALTQKGGASKISSKIWIVLVQLALLAVAIPGALLVGIYLD
jgi:hypothetical protein